MTIIITNKPISMSEKSKPRKLKFKFETEYTQIRKDGINTILKEYSVTFKDLTVNIETLDSTLSELGATEAFLWNPYVDIDNTEVAKPFICEEWEVSYDAPGYSILSATFKQQADNI